jgi:hypothetical protein
VVAAVGFITIRQPGTEPVVQTVPASQVPVMQLAILLFVLTGSTLGGGVYALFAWQWYLRRDNRVMTVSGVVWLMFIGPAVAAIIGFIMFGLARANVVPDDMWLGTPPAPISEDIPPDQLADAQWIYLIELAFYWLVQGIGMGLAWQVILSGLVWLFNRRYSGFFKKITPRFLRRGR